MSGDLRLPGSARRNLREALKSGFSDYATLNRFAIEGLGVNLDDRTNAVAGRDTAIDTLVTMMDEMGRIPELVAGARAERPGNTSLRGVARDLGLTFDAFADPRPDPAMDAVIEGGKLERVITQSAGFPSSESVVSALGIAEYRVCYLTYGLPGAARVYGTAFLVGDSLLMTNFHVIEKACTPFQFGGGQISAVFDYRGADAKTTKYLLAAADWLVASDPVLRADGQRGLDYALLRLSEAVANHPISASSSSASRGFFQPVSYQPSSEEPVLILQHPYDQLDARPSTMRLTIGFVRDVTDQEIQDTANTSEGSSGSPVFNSRMEWIGLHHWGSATSNTAKRVSAIKADLAAKGLSHLLASP